MDYSNEEIADQVEAMDRLTETFLRYKQKLLENMDKAYDFRLNPTKYHILKTIYKKQSCMVIDIARELQLSSGATTISLNQLEEDRLIVRLRSKEDRRTVKTTLTDKGRQVIEETMAARQRLFADLLEPLTGGEREQFFELIHKMSEQLARKIDSDSI
ncbi:MarR family transcriptional regulator [Paenibacillus filicis]|uniref:MarR family transcriptional regulator n=1 Tax=Paenibacillus gyeongsangnamensis TaxID=3388067 RepID=A0ABT4QID6_9BACL|nr:MarR family transcriptional regulator [Paenibacillus filicis]MCZ8516445.1 MarR family transcriptional regulator [Paenibacillus filicis]